MRAGVLTASLLAVLCLGSGCSSKCEAVCDEANACSVKERSVDVECTPFCADVEDFQARAKQAGQECTSQWEEHLNCWDAGSSSICQSPDDSEKSAECAEKAQAWVDCMKPYCEAVAEAEDGYDPNCDGGEPLLLPF